MTEKWTTSQVAEFLELRSPDAARVQLRRWGVQAISRQLGAKGENEYDAERVRRAKENRAGRGARTDLRSELASESLARDQEGKP